MPPIIPITDPDDPRIAGYRHIRERDLVRRDGRFIAEGEVVLRVLLTAGEHRAESLLIAEKRLAALEPLLDRVPEGVPVYAAGQSVLDAIAGFPLHRGILALGRRAPMPTAEDLLAGLGPRALVAVLVGIGNHDNVGGIFRNAAAFGADAVFLDAGCCDPLYRKAIRVSVGASLFVPFARVERGADILALLAERNFTPLALSPAGDVALAELPRPPRGGRAAGFRGTGPARRIARPGTDGAHPHGRRVRLPQRRHRQRHRLSPSVRSRPGGLGAPVFGPRHDAEGSASGRRTPCSPHSSAKTSWIRAIISLRGDTVRSTIPICRVTCG